jgi:hypothetical protein
MGTQSPSSFCTSITPSSTWIEPSSVVCVPALTTEQATIRTMVPKWAANKSHRFDFLFVFMDISYLSIKYTNANFIIAQTTFPNTLQNWDEDFYTNMEIVV